MSATIAAVVAGVHRAFPPEWAESWDRVGLLAGDPAREVTGVSCALDATVASVRVAAEEGANLLVTHHPAFMDPPLALAPGMGPSAVLFQALDAGIALLNAHTNLDRAPQASGVLPGMLELDIIGPIERRLQPMALVTVYVPNGHETVVADAMSSAGAGRIGEYERCLFRAGGTGEFTSPVGGTPFVGSPGEASSAEEVRLEMVAPRGNVPAAVEAARGAHPYEEPLITVTEIAMARSSARMGVLCEAGPLTTLDALVESASEVFGVTPRVWGPPSAKLARIATATGSAGSLVDDAIAAGADALLAGEVRYHDALEASARGLAIVEVGHDASEWPLVDVLAQAVRATPDLDPNLVRVQPAAVGWWTPGKDR